MNVLVIGAGAVGRGLIAPLFARDNHVRFYDTNIRLATRLNREHCYFMSDGESPRLHSVRVAAAYYKAHQAISWVTRSDLIFVAVRVENLASVAEILREGLPLGKDPLKPVVVCENTPDSAGVLREAAGIQGTFVNAIAECIIPEPTPAMRKRDPLLMYHDPRGYLVVDGDAAGSSLITSIPDISFADNFPLAWDLKWYLHCALHALVAYLGIKAGCTYIHEAMADKEINKHVQKVMVTAEYALTEKYPGFGERIHERLSRELDSLRDNTRPDPCTRVGRDAARKCAKGERLDSLLQIVGGKNATVEQALAVAREVANAP